MCIRDSVHLIKYLKFTFSLLTVYPENEISVKFNAPTDVNNTIGTTQKTMKPISLETGFHLSQWIYIHQLPSLFSNQLSCSTSLTLRVFEDKTFGCGWFSVCFNQKKEIVLLTDESSIMTVRSAFSMIL